MPEEEPEDKIEPDPEEESGEKNENVLESADISVAPAMPVIVCQEDSELMEIEGVRSKRSRGKRRISRIRIQRRIPYALEI